MNQRQQKILGLLAEDAHATVSRLSRAFQVSDVTIRQDLTQLENEGLLKRVHGGAVLRQSEDIASRLGFNYAAKARIAARAAELVEEGETVLIESGSANALLARELSGRRGINLVTTNVFIARELRNRKTQVILLGGIYQHESESLVGSLTRTCLEQIHFSKAFLGIDGYTPSAGFTSTDLMRAEIAAIIAHKAEEVYVVSDSSKFGRVGLTGLFPPEQVSCVITDNGIPYQHQTKLEARGVKIIAV